MDKALTFSDRWNALCFEPQVHDWPFIMAVSLGLAGLIVAAIIASRS